MHEASAQNEVFEGQDMINLVHEWFRAFNAHDVSALVNLHTENATHYSPKLKVKRPETGGIIRGKEELKKWWEIAFKTIEDLRYEIRNITTQRNRIVVEYTRHAGNDEDMEVAEVYEVEKIMGNLRIKVSRVYHG